GRGRAIEAGSMQLAAATPVIRVLGERLGRRAGDRLRGIFGRRRLEQTALAELGIVAVRRLREHRSVCGASRVRAVAQLADAPLPVPRAGTIVRERGGDLRERGDRVAEATPVVRLPGDAPQRFTYERGIGSGGDHAMVVRVRLGGSSPQLGDPAERVVRVVRLRVAWRLTQNRREERLRLVVTVVVPEERREV